MNILPAKDVETRALEQAAKYICTSKCGLCPMVTEGFNCPGKCDLETKAWECWIAFFQEKVNRYNRGNYQEKNINASYYDDS